MRFLAILLLVHAASSPWARETKGVGQPQPQPTIRSGVQMIEVDVRAFTEDGRFITDLTGDDFEVFENGVRQAVQALYLVRETAGVPATRGAELRFRATSVTSSSAPALPATGQTWIFFFDLNHLTPGGGFERARQAVAAFIQHRFAPGDVAGIVTPAKMVNNRLTSVREELTAAVASIKPLSDARFRRLDQMALNVRTIDDDADYAIRSAQARLLTLETARASRETIQAFRGLVEQLAYLAGPKTIVFLSDGFEIALPRQASSRAIVNQTIAAGARIYPIDVRGLNRDMGAGDVELPPVDINDVTALRPPRVGIFEEDAGNSLAEASGGFMIRAENNLGRAMDLIATDAGTYYVLGYHSSNTKFDGKLRSIEVRVKRQDVRVRARYGYLALDPSKMPVPQPIK